MTKDTLASFIIGARRLSPSQLRAILARLDFVIFEPAPFDMEQMQEAVEYLLEKSEIPTTNNQ